MALVGVSQSTAAKIAFNSPKTAQALNLAAHDCSNLIRRLVA